MKRKIWKAAAAAGLFAVLTLAPAGIAMAAGWTQTANGWTYVQDGGTLRKGWIQTTDGYYYMDLSTGTMCLGWKQIDGK